MSLKSEDPLRSDIVHAVPISSLVEADSPRMEGESRKHIELLLASDADWPPILVHRQTMRVIDGVHRLRATVLRGEREVRVTFFEGDEVEAFILAVKANVTHGLPLSLSDRTAAAKRIISSRPHLSDRSIASSAGLSPKTIAAIRKRVTADLPQLNARVGRDGKIRPIDSSDGRQLAAHLIEMNPRMSLRELAKSAGVSLGTAHDVCKRLRAGQDPLPGYRRGPSLPRPADVDGSIPSGPRPLGVASPDPRVALRNLKRDPSLRFSETGRTLLRLLDAQALGAEQWNEMIASVPPHRADVITKMALTFASAWHRFAEELRGRFADSA